MARIETGPMAIYVYGQLEIQCSRVFCVDGFLVLFLHSKGKLSMSKSSHVVFAPSPGGAIDVPCARLSLDSPGGSTSTARKREMAVTMIGPSQDIRPAEDRTERNQLPILPPGICLNQRRVSWPIPHPIRIKPPPIWKSDDAARFKHLLCSFSCWR